MSDFRNISRALAGAAMVLLISGCQASVPSNAGSAAPPTAESTSAPAGGDAVRAVTPDVIPTATPPPTATRTATPLPSATPQPTEAPATETPQRSGSTSSVSSVPLRLVIDDISLDRPLFAVGLDADNIPVVPDHDIGWYIYSSRPGQGENIVLWGHVLRFRNAPQIPAPFADLDEVPVGADLSLYTDDGTEHRYRVIERVLATPDQVEYILPRGRELLTLVSCYGDQIIVEGSVEMSHRLITIAAPIDG